MSGKNHIKQKVDPLTPRELGAYLVDFVLNRVDYRKGDRFYEPFMGNGAFYDFMPEPKDWAEIEYGRDFFEYKPFDGKVDHVITNPPYRTYIDGVWSNAYIPILERCMSFTRKSISFLTNHKIFNAFTPTRMQRYYESGWAITHIHVLSIKKWFGRYYFIIFQKNKKPILTWNTKTWE